MSTFIPWNSQSLDEYTEQFAAGQTVELDGHITHYIEAGQGDPLILIHGFNFDSFTWAKNLDALAQRHKVYALDLWGFGYSTRELLDFGYPLFAKQLKLFMDTLNIEKATLVGHSMGGGTAAYFALNNPDRVQNLILVDATGVTNPLPIRGRIFQLPHVAEFMLGLKSNMVRRKNITDFWIHRHELLTGAYFTSASRFQKIAGTTETLLSVLRRNFFDTLEQELRALSRHDIPTLIIWGEYDKPLPVQRGRTMHQILSGSRLEIIEEAGHMPNFDQADRFNELVLDFLAEPQASSDQRQAMFSPSR